MFTKLAKQIIKQYFNKELTEWWTLENDTNNGYFFRRHCIKNKRQTKTSRSRLGCAIVLRGLDTQHHRLHWISSKNKREGATIYDGGPLYWVEETQWIVSYRLYLPSYCHTTQVVAAAAALAAMMEHPSLLWERMFAYYFIIPRGHRKISPSVVIVTG